MPLLRSLVERDGREVMVDVISLAATTSQFWEIHVASHWTVHYDIVWRTESPILNLIITFESSYMPRGELLDGTAVSRLLQVGVALALPGVE